MKRFKPPRGKKITMSVKEFNKKIEEAVDTAVGNAGLLYMVAMKDEYGYSDEDIEKVFVRAERYTNYLKEKEIDLKDLAETLTKDTGIKIEWR